jgi:hypothetical protein
LYVLLLLEAPLKLKKKLRKRQKKLTVRRNPFLLKNCWQRKKQRKRQEAR